MIKPPKSQQNPKKKRNNTTKKNDLTTNQRKITGGPPQPPQPPPKVQRKITSLFKPKLNSETKNYDNLLLAKSDRNEQTSKDVQSSNLSADSNQARSGQDYAEVEHSRILEVATTSPDLDQKIKTNFT